MKFLKKNLLVLLMGCAFLSAGLTSCKGKSDADIQTDVNAKLGQSNESSGLTASVNEGVVTLTGECKDETCRNKCADEVKEIKGVKSVVNNIQIARAEPTTAPVEISGDETLRSSVSEVVKSYDGVQAEVKDGVVTLRGQIKRDNLQKLMVSLNELKPKKVENELVIK